MAAQTNGHSHPDGLTLRYFKHFVDIHGGRDTFTGLTTTDVCNQFLLPYTNSTQLSLVEHVRLQENGDEYVQPAQWFVSHSWSYVFLDLMDSLDAFLERIGLDDSVSLWFCTFCNNQHQIQNQVHEFKHWFSIFESSLRVIGNVVMVFDCWNDPGTLSRAWCVFEVYVSIIAKARFEVAMPRDAESVFQDDGVFFRMLSKIKSEQSQTTVPSDKDNIFDLIQDQVGFTKLDRMVFEALDQWMTRTVQERIDTAAHPEKKAHWLSVMADMMAERTRYDLCQEALDSAIAIYEELEVHEDAAAIWQLRSRLAYIRARTNQPRESWLPLWDQVLTEQTKLLSKEHKHTLETLHGFGLLCCYDGMPSKGLAMMQECLEIKERILGHDDISTLTTLGSYTAYYVRQTKDVDVSKAKQLLVECYERQARVLGEDHMNSNLSRYNLGVWCIQNGFYTMGFDHIDASYRANVRLLGADHPNTLMACLVLGQSLFYTGENEDAERTLLSTMESFEKLNLPLWLSHCRYIDFESTHDGVGYRHLGTFYRNTNQWTKSLEYLTRAMDTLPTKKPTDGEERTRSSYLYALYQLLVDIKPSEQQLEWLQTAMNDANWDHDSWTFLNCLGCYQLIDGSLFDCEKCHRIRLCHVCVNERPSHTFDICTHATSVLIEYKPATRYLHEKKLDQLANEMNWEEYTKHYQVYSAYCSEYNVPGVQIAKRNALLNSKNDFIPHNN